MRMHGLRELAGDDLVTVGSGKRCSVGRQHGDVVAHVVGRVPAKTGQRDAELGDASDALAKRDAGSEERKSAGAGGDGLQKTSAMHALQTCTEGAAWGRRPFATSLTVRREIDKRSCVRYHI